MVGVVLSGIAECIAQSAPQQRSPEQVSKELHSLVQGGDSYIQRLMLDADARYWEGYEEGYWATHPTMTRPPERNKAKAQSRKAEEKNVNDQLFGGRESPPENLDGLRAALSATDKIRHAKTIESWRELYAEWMTIQLAGVTDAVTRMIGESAYGSHLKKIDEELALLKGDDAEKAPRNQDAVTPDTSTDGTGPPQTIIPETDTAPTSAFGASPSVHPLPHAGPLDPTKYDFLRDDYEALYPNLAGSEWEITELPITDDELKSWDKRGLEPPNCQSHVLGIDDRAQELLPPGVTGEGQNPYAWNPYERLDAVYGEKGYGNREKFEDGRDYPTGSILVYEGKVWGRSNPRHVAINNAEGRWESVTHPGGPLITHTKPSAVQGVRAGYPKYVYKPK